MNRIPSVKRGVISYRLSMFLNHTGVNIMDLLNRNYFYRGERIEFKTQPNRFILIAGKLKQSAVAGEVVTREMPGESRKEFGYEGIMRGLNETLEHTEGKRELRTNTLHIEPVREYQAEEIKKIRNDLGMTQAFFAGFSVYLNKMYK